MTDLQWHRMDDPDNPPPKDGTWILVFEAGVALVLWEEATQDERNKGWGDGWYDAGTFPYNPTHWMPLPQPPQEGKS